MQGNEQNDSQNEDFREDLIGQCLRQWRDVRPDIDLSGKAVVSRLMYLANLARQNTETVLNGLDLTYYEYSVLSTLRVAGEACQLPPSVLKSTLLFTSGGLSNLLKRLEKRTLVQRTDNPEDGRGVLVCLTPEGKRLADVIMPRVSASKLELVRMLNARERSTLARLLRRVGMEYTAMYTGA